MRIYKAQPSQMLVCFCISQSVKFCSQVWKRYTDILFSGLTRKCKLLDQPGSQGSSAPPKLNQQGHIGPIFRLKASRDASYQDFKVPHTVYVACAKARLARVKDERAVHRRLPWCNMNTWTWIYTLEGVFSISLQFLTKVYIFQCQWRLIYKMNLYWTISLNGNALRTTLGYYWYY